MTEDHPSQRQLPVHVRPDPFDTSMYDTPVDLMKEQVELVTAQDASVEGKLDSLLLISPGMKE